MNSIHIAFASNDGNHFIDEHFGDAKTYYIYEISQSNARFIKTVNNPKFEKHTFHSDPNKAKSISQSLKSLGVQALANKAFGGNIKKMSKEFVCIIMNHSSIENAIITLQSNFITLSEFWEKGSDRPHLVLRN